MEKEQKAKKTNMFVIFRGWKMDQPSTTGTERFANDKSAEAALMGKLTTIGERFVLKWTSMFQVRPGRTLPRKVEAYLKLEAERLKANDKEGQWVKVDSVQVQVQEDEKQLVVEKEDPPVVDEKEALLTEEEKEERRL